MANQSRNKMNQSPTGEGKKQSPQSGQEKELSKRSEVLQAQRGHPELNMGTNAEENAQTQAMDVPTNAKRQKAGR